MIDNRYTGFLDKYNNHIFEEDIITDGEQEIVVKYDNNQFQLHYQVSGAVKSISDIDVLCSEFEIIDHVEEKE